MLQRCAARSSRYYDGGGGGDDDAGAQDRRPLWEKLKENNDKKQADFEEKISLKNSVCTKGAPFPSPLSPFLPRLAVTELLQAAH